MYKILHIINTVTVLITLVFYCSEIMSGMTIQLFMGGLQLLTALVIGAKNENKKFKKLLNIYWTLVIITFSNIVLLSLISTYSPKIYDIITMCIIPMLTACYFVFVTGYINNKIKQ